MADPIARPAGSVAPASFLEWAYSLFPPDKYAWKPNARGITLVQGAVPLFGNQILVDIPLFCREIRVAAWQTGAAGPPPVSPFTVEILEAGESWLGGPWVPQLEGLAQLGAGLNLALPLPFDFPREIAANTQITAQVNNGLFPAAGLITVQVLLYGYEPRLRQSPVRRAADGSAILPGG